MLRRALTYHLIFAVAVGPLLCCCSSGKASASSLPVTSHDRAPAELTSSCCAHKQVPAKADHTEKPVPAKPSHPVEKCPCKDGSDQPQTVQTESAQGDLSTFLRLLALDTVALAASEAVVSCPNESDRRRGSDCPRMTTSELLYVHHNLRC